MSILSSLNFNDVITTIGAVTAGVIAWRQKEKDTQLSAMKDTIEFLKDHIKYLEGRWNGEQGKKD